MNSIPKIRKETKSKKRRILEFVSDSHVVENGFPPYMLFDVPPSGFLAFLDLMLFVVVKLSVMLFVLCIVK
jgi:hypothetical protein